MNIFEFFIIKTNPCNFLTHVTKQKKINECATEAYQQQRKIKRSNPFKNLLG